MRIIGGTRYDVMVNGRPAPAVGNVVNLMHFIFLDLAHIATVRITSALTGRVNHALPPDILIYVTTEPRIPLALLVRAFSTGFFHIVVNVMVGLTEPRRSLSDSIQPVEQLVMEQLPPQTQTSMFSVPYFFPPQHHPMGSNPIYENSTPTYYPVIDPNLDRPSLVISPSGLTEHL